jgi:hypothetical protein
MAKYNDIDLPSDSWASRVWYLSRGQELVVRRPSYPYGLCAAATSRP